MWVSRSGQAVSTTDTLITYVSMSTMGSPPSASSSSSSLRPLVFLGLESTLAVGGCVLIHRFQLLVHVPPTHYGGPVYKPQIQFVVI